MDKMKIEILDDGTISIRTSEISQKNHLSADEFLTMINKLAGGEVKQKPAKHNFWENRDVLKGGKIVENKGK